MATPYADVEAMQSEIKRLSQTVETLKKDAPAVLTHRKPSYSTDGDSPPPRMCNAPPSLQRYDDYPQARSNAAKRKEIPVRRYTGKEPISDYLKQFELTARHNRWDDEDRVTSLLCALEGEARSILAEIDHPDQIGYAEIKQKLLQRFGPTQHPEVHEHALHDLRLARGQSIRELTPEVNRLTKLAYPDFEPAARNRLAVNALLNAIPDKDVTFYVKDKNPTSLEDVCVLYERYKVLTGHSSHHKPATIKGVPPENDGYPPQQIDQSLFSALLKQKEEQQKQLQELTNTVSMLVQAQQTVQSTANTVTPLIQPQAYPQWSGSPASFSTQQRASATPGQSGTAHPRANRPPPGPCPNCKQTGHWRRDCKVNPSEYAAGHTVPHSAQESLKAPAAYLSARVDGQLRHCLLDSGADVSLIPSQMVKPDTLSPAPFPLLAVNNTSLITDGVTTLNVAVRGKKLPATFFVTPNIDEVILGRDWLTANGAVWDFATQSISVGDQRLQLRSKSSTANSCKRCIAKADITIPPRSEAVIPAHVVYSRFDKHQLSTPHWSTSLYAPINGLRVARTLIDSNSGTAGIRVCNITERPLSLHRGCTVSPLQPVSTLTNSQPDPEAASTPSTEHIRPILDRVDLSVPADTRNRLDSLLCTYSDVFSKSEFDLGCTNIVHHRIDTQGNPPFRQPLRPQPRAQLPVIDQLLVEMQDQGVIEPCTSDWASNVVLVKKKDGSVRFCVDYRKLNLLTRKDAYPLPRIDRCLDSLSGSTWFSTFDLRSGFHQVEVHPRDANKTTFICHRGTFRFPKMPFGLCNAPATFQRLMDTVLTNLNFEICLAYLDDIIVFSHDLNSHMERLQRLFDRLREANLKLKPSKCQVLQRQVHFLGFTVSQHGVGTDPGKVEAIKDWPTPQNLRQSRAFVGLCQYYRRFVPGFSEISAPLHALTKKGARFHWSEECQHAFDQLKNALTSAPVLSLPNDHDEFVLDCDASNHSIGGVLSQIQDGVEKPICFASQLYNKHEANYNVTRKELLAVVTFVKKFRQYLLGRPFRIRIDHAALQWLKRTPEPIGQQARWLEILEEYNYTIEHRADRNHLNADALSRRVETVTSAAPTIIEPINWATEQAKDPCLAFVSNLVQTELPAPPAEELTSLSAETKTLCGQLNQLVLIDGVLHRRSETGSTQKSLQKVVPRQLRKQIADEMHKGLNGGHFGNRRAKAKLRERFYWPGWGTEVRLAKRRCEQCSRFQRAQPRHQGNMQPMIVGEPWERLGIDITGPHPVSSKGNTYVLTVIDHFTKWVELFPLRNQEAATVAQILVDKVFCAHGLPVQILTDQGPNFESELFRQLCYRMGVDKIRTSPYQPSTNGNIERFHATMHGLIAKWVNSNHRDWDTKLPAVAFAYRSSVQESTGFTPFFLMYGREARVPADLVYGEPQTEGPNNDFVVRQQENLCEAYTLVREHLAQAARRRKKRYDLRTLPRKFPVGTKVWCYVPRRYKGRYQKWRSLYQGPFEVIEQLGPVTYRIRRDIRSRPWVVHVDKLKPCFADTEPVTPASDVSPSDEDRPDDDVVSRPKRRTQRPARYRE